jgi:heme/copper-type cytochrome/quinol oxidase subunit 2
VIPSIIVVFLYYYGFKQYMNLVVEPPNAYPVDVTGRMWQWSFAYPNGYSDRELHVPVNVPVRCVLESSDVIHSLSIPAFRVKKDVVPGRYNRLWFQATSADGSFYLATFRVNGYPRDFAFDLNGELVANVPTQADLANINTPNDLAMTFSELPKPVQDAVAAQLPGAKVPPTLAIDSYSLLNGTTLNVVDYRDGRTRTEVIVDQDGKAPEKQTVQFNALPPAVQANMRRAAHGAEIVDAQPILRFNDAEPFEVFCTDYCGTNHSTMHSRVIVHRSQADFDKWLAGAAKPDPDPRVRGRKLYTKLGCAQCHSVDGTKITGPSWKDLYGSTQQFSDGSTAVVNEEFLHTFIPAPTVKVPVGFPPVMPPFPIPNAQIDDIAAYMKTISKYAPAPSMGGGAGVGTTQPAAAEPTSAPAAK